MRYLRIISAAAMFCAGTLLFGAVKPCDLSLDELAIYKQMLITEEKEAVLVSTTAATGDVQSQVRQINLQEVVRHARVPNEKGLFVASDDGRTIQIPVELGAELSRIGNVSCELPIRKMHFVRKYMSSSEHKRLFAVDVDQGWRRFHQKFGNEASLDEFSRVAFTKDRKWALLYCSSGVAAMGGAGAFYLFRHNGSEWRRVNVFMLWVT